jgi:hypothetical protein
MDIHLSLDVAEVDLLLSTLEDHELDFDCLPQIRALLLGPYAYSKLFPPTFCREPTRPEMEQIFYTLKRQGLVKIAWKLRKLAEGKTSPAKQILDHLETLEPEQWNHPAQVFQRPWHLERVLALCQKRMESTNPERRGLLASIAEKLERAQGMEVQAAERRRRLYHPKPKGEKK